MGVEPDRIEIPEIDETPLPRERPQDHARRIAGAKRDAVAERIGAAPAIILAADTVVACGRRILPKPDDRSVAEQCLRLLSGRRHRVYGGVAVAANGRRVDRVVTTMVRFKRLEPREIAAYLESGEWRGKAGGYAIQGRAEGFIVDIHGSYSNVVGLPLAVTLGLLHGLGWWPEP